MNRLILACCLVLTSIGAFAQAADAALKQRINAFVDEWHDDAAHARMAYFDKIAKDGVYIGTDKAELWRKDEFKVWAQKYFERKSAWAFKTIRRNVYASADKHIIWFDELLDTSMGVCQASGVIHRTPTGFEIEHYQLSIAVPNDLSAGISKTIKQFEAQAGAK
jgi:hypothetical protein